MQFGDNKGMALSCTIAKSNNKHDLHDSGVMARASQAAQRLPVAYFQEGDRQWLTPKEQQLLITAGKNVLADVFRAE